MPTLEENRRAFEATHDWSRRGEEWSEPWGGSAWQWHGSVLPRIQGFVPAPTILEIAPGFGRWSRFLAPLAERLLLVDLSQRCVAACRELFAGDSRVECFQNDGRSLPMVAERSVDFAFSFDSLVHAEADVLAAYVGELARVLAADGVAFLHHSNLGAFRAHAFLSERLPVGQSLLRRIGLLEPSTQWRAASMSAVRLRQFAAAAGLSVVSQELVNWKSRRLIDAFAVLTRPGSRFDGEPVERRSPGFMDEAARCRALSRLYPSADAAGAGGRAAAMQAARADAASEL